MSLRRRLSRAATASLGAIVAAGAVIACATVPAQAAEPISVPEALAGQDGSEQSVSGYVVGQPVATGSVIREDFPNDYALALAADSGQTDVDEILYVQVTSPFRAEWGLQSNPELLGERIEVTGELTDYFAHPGLNSPVSFAFANGEVPAPEPTEPTPEPTPEPTEPSPEPTGPAPEPTEPPTDPGIPAGYYDGAEGLTGDALKQALHNAIDDHTSLGYDEVWDALQQTDEDPGNPANIITVYSRMSLPKSAHGGDADDWNREHTWAKSHGDFGTSMGPGTDVHHLMPEDASVNSTRSNLDFDESGGAVEQCPQCAVDEDSFEPPDETKGDIARAMFYMAVRYDGSEYVDLELNDTVDNGSAPYIGRLSVLLEWHELDPVSEFEIRRNGLIYDDWQGNRNPFIDHPEWAAAIWG